MAIPDRRAFLDLFASAGLASTLLPGLLWAQIRPGTRTISADMVREAARLAGMTPTDDEATDLTLSLSSLAKHAEEIDKSTLTNASPLPIHFDPRPPGVPLPAPPADVFRLEAAPAVTRPRPLEAAAFWPVTHLARLVRTRQVTSVELTSMYLDRLKRYNAQLNCVAALTEERAFAEARAADAAIARGRYLGVLHGIPYGVKDIIAATGAPTRWGAALRDVEAIMFTSLALDSRTSLNPLMSLTGHPSVALPSGFGANGSSTGVMFSGHLYREGEILALARAFQDDNRQYEKLPPLFAGT